MVSKPCPTPTSTERASTAYTFAIFGIDGYRIESLDEVLTFEEETVF